MSLVYLDRVMESSTTTGVGAYSLAGAITGHQAVSGIGNGNTGYFCAFEVDSNGNASGGWEVFLGTYASSGNTLARTSVLKSTNSNNAVSWSAGTRRIMLGHPADIISALATAQSVTDEATARIAADLLLAPKASPTFTGTVTLPSGTSLTSPVLITPTLGVAVGTSLALNGATLGSHTLALTGSVAVSGQIQPGSWAISGFGDPGGVWASVNGVGANNFLLLASTGYISSNLDTYFRRAAAANWQLGDTASATPVNQKLSAQNASGSNIAGATLTIAPGVSTGNATPASVIIQSTVAGSSGSSAQTLSNTLEVANGNVKMGLLSGSTTGTLVGVVSNVPGIWFGANTASPGFTNYSFLYAGTGSIFNSPSGMPLFFRIANVTKWQIDANGHLIGGGAQGDAATSEVFQKPVASIADNTATPVFTVTIPNAAHSASIRVRLVGASGAGGSIGAGESTQEAEYLINITRTAGVNAVAAIGAVIGQPAAVTVAGGNAVAVSATLGAISGAVGATNTFTIQVTIARAGGTATNHTCMAFAELLNANASGVTIA